MFSFVHHLKFEWREIEGGIENPISISAISILVPLQLLCPHTHTYTLLISHSDTLGVVNRGHIEMGLQWGFYPLLYLTVPPRTAHTHPRLCFCLQFFCVWWHIFVFHWVKILKDCVPLCVSKAMMCSCMHLLQPSLAYLGDPVPSVPLYISHLSHFYLSRLPTPSLSTVSDTPDWSVGAATHRTTPPFDTIDK